MAVQSAVTELQRCPAHGGQQVAAQREAPGRNLIALSSSEDVGEKRNWLDFAREDDIVRDAVDALCAAGPAVQMVNECVDDVPEDEGPGSSEAVLHLHEQQVDEQVIHEQDAMTFIAVGRLRCSFTHRQQNPLDGNLQHKKKQTD